MGEGVLNSRSSFNESDRENGCWPDLEMYRHNWTCCGHNLLCFDWFAYLTPLLCFAHLVFPFGLFPLFLFFFIICWAIMSALHLRAPIPTTSRKKKLKAIEPNFVWMAGTLKRVAYWISSAHLKAVHLYKFCFSCLFSALEHQKSNPKKKTKQKRGIFSISLSLEF